MILVTSMKLDFTKGRRGAGKGRGERVVEVEVATHVAGSSNGWCMVRMLCRAILKDGTPLAEHPKRIVGGAQVNKVRVVHGFCCTGVAGMGPVSDLPTHGNTAPIMGNLQVSAIHSHALFHSCHTHCMQ